MNLRKSSIFACMSPSSLNSSASETVPVIFAMTSLAVSVRAIGTLLVSPASMGAPTFQRIANRPILIGEGAETGERPGLLAPVEMGVDVPDLSRREAA